MTSFGKLLVLVNLTFSFLAMSWALGVLANRIDWSNNKPKDDQPGGELNKREIRIKELVALVRPAESAWREPRNSLVDPKAGLEVGRSGDRGFYQAEMQHLRSGATDADPVRSVVYDKGSPVRDPMANNRLKMAPAADRAGKPLKSLTALEEELNITRTAIVAEVEKIQKAVDEDTRLTNLLVGTQMPPVKGLRQRIIDERAKITDVDLEQKMVKPMLINTFVESQLILKRAEELKARIRELERTGVATGKD